MSTTQLNGQTYAVDIILQRISTKESDKILSELFILPQYINEIRLTNSINELFPTAEIKVSDKTINNIVQFTSDGYTYLKLVLEYDLSKQGIPIDENKINLKAPENHTKIEHIFFIDDISIADQDNINEIFWKLSCSSILAPKLQSYTEYSTTGLLKTPTTIAREILVQLNYPYEKLKDYPETDRRINYITPAWFSINDNLKYLLQNSASIDKGLYYLIYNLVKQTGKIESINSLFNVEPDNINNILKIPTRAGIDQQSSFTVRGFQTNNLIKGGTLFNINSEIKYNNFNYLTRERSQTIYNESKLINSFPKITSQKDIIQTTTKSKPKFLNVKKTTMEEVDSELANNQLWYKMDRLFKYTNICQFQILPGFLMRDVGKIFNLKCDDPIINSYYGGRWMIGRIDHVIVPEKSYVNEITGIRSTEYNFKEDEKGKVTTKGVA